MNFSVLIFIISILFATSIIIYIVIRKDFYFRKGGPINIDSASGLPTRLNVHEFGNLEGDIENLDEVIVVAHTIEKPEGSLYNSVWKNFSRNVKYTFLISRSTFNTEQNGFYKIFQALLDVAKTRASSENKLENNLKIKSLKFDWDDYPYVFYRIKKQGDPSNLYLTFAYRGTQQNEGIADNYVLINPALANSISKALNEATHDNSLQKVEKEFEYGSIKMENIIRNINDVFQPPRKNGKPEKV